jgi:hypothetical protein
MDEAALVASLEPVARRQRVEVGVIGALRRSPRTAVAGAPPPRVPDGDKSAEPSTSSGCSHSKARHRVDLSSGHFHRRPFTLAIAGLRAVADFRACPGGRPEARSPRPQGRRKDRPRAERSRASGWEMLLRVLECRACRSASTRTSLLPRALRAATSTPTPDWSTCERSTWALGDGVGRRGSSPGSPGGRYLLRRRDAVASGSASHPVAPGLAAGSFEIAADAEVTLEPIQERWTRRA